MKYSNVVIGRVVKRVSRFTVTVDLKGEHVAAHLSNTGRNKELLLPGAPISVRKADNPARKTPYDILAVQRAQRWINIDSLAPNRVVNAALNDGSLVLRRASNLIRCGRKRPTWTAGWILRVRMQAVRTGLLRSKA